MKNDEQNGLSYHRIQRLIKEQIDRIEHETDAKTDERVYRDNLAKCSFIAIIKRFWSMKCCVYTKNGESQIRPTEQTHLQNC